MRLLIVLALVLTSSLVTAKDCSKVIEEKITQDYPYSIETMTMQVKRVGRANTGHRFEGSRRTPPFDIYTAGTSDEGGGILYFSIVNAKTCQIIKLEEFHQQDD